MSRDTAKQQREKVTPAPEVLVIARHLSDDSLAKTIEGLRALLRRKLKRISALAKPKLLRQDMLRRP